MRDLRPARVMVFACLLLLSGWTARANTITGLSIAPAEAPVGASVTATAAGAGPCGAVHINWGDGPGITYATAALPVTQTHVYQSAGTYTVRAQGMGNCAGEATARVTITAPPAPPAAPKLSALELAPTPVLPRRPVAITLQGTGSCRVTVDFGDGNTQEVAGDLPLSLRHTYPLAGTYTLKAIPAPPCTQPQSANLQVGTAPGQAITRLNVNPVQGAAPGLHAIEVVGAGRCTYLLDYGDGNSETRTASLPETIRHNYPAEGRYTIVTTAQPPCSGVLRSTFVVGRSRQAPGAISGLSVSPERPRYGQPLTLTVAGTGTCRLTIDLDDGESRTVTETLPHRFSYRYAEPGDYDIVVWTSEPCTGGADTRVRVRRR